MRVLAPPKEVPFVMPSKCNKLLVVNIACPGDSCYVDPRRLTLYMEQRRLSNHLFFSIGKKDFARMLIPESSDLGEIQIEFLRQLKNDWKP